MVGCWSWLAALDEQTGWAAAAIVKTPHMGGGGAHLLPHHEKVQCLQWGYALASLGHTKEGDSAHMFVL